MNKKYLAPLRWGVQLFFLFCVLWGLSFGVKPLATKLTIVSLIFFVGTYYCGWVCSFGTLQDILWAVNRRFIKKQITVPPQYDRYLSWIRYVSLFVSLGAVMSILDTRRIFFSIVAGRALTAAAILCFALTLLLGLFMSRPFCRYVCPEGARYGLVGLSRLFTVTRRDDLCVHCGACDRSCPMAIPLSSSIGLNTPQCISCARCIEACPKPGALSLKLRNLRNPVTLAFFLAGLYFLATYVLNAFKRFG